MKFSDMLISLTGTTSRARAIEELAWKSNIYAQEAEKLVDALDKMMLNGAWITISEALRDAPVPYQPMPWERLGDNANLLKTAVDKLPILDGLTVTDTRTSLFDVLDTLRNKEGVDIYAEITNAINDTRVTRWQVEVVTTLIVAWLGDEFFTRTKPTQFDAVESMRHIVQQSEHHIGATRNTLIRAVVLKAMDDGHHVLPTLLECAQIAAKQLKEKSDAQA